MLNWESTKKIAASEQAEIKRSALACQSFNINYFYDDEICVKLIEPHMMTLRCSKNVKVLLEYDYKMGRIILHWESSAKPANKSYLQKIAHHILGIFNSSSRSRKVYQLDKPVFGDVDSDLVCSYLTDNTFSSCLR